MASKISFQFRKFLAAASCVLWIVPLVASSQTLFQNSNQECGSQVVLCDSFSNTNNNLFCEHDAVSIACRNVSGIVDFNGDGFPDCVASTYGTANDAQGLTTSVLMNQGSVAACPGTQFNPSSDYVLTGLTDSQQVIDIGTVVAGQLDGTGNSDFAAPEVRTVSPKHVSSVLGFDPITPDESILNTADVNWEPIGTSQEGFNFDLFDSSASERGMALFDCDNNGTLDAVIGVLEAEPSSAPVPFDFRINILKNDGTGLQAIGGAADSFDTGVSFNDSPSEGALAVGDFNGDGFLDVVMEMQQFSGGSKVSVCLNDQSCGFTCSVQVNLADAHPNDSDPFPSSIAAGDFDGNGTDDIVVTEPGLSFNSEGIHYYFGNGDGTFQAGGMHLTLDQPDQRTPKVLTTGCFNNDNVTDVAVSCDGSGVVSFSDASVQVITSDGAGGFHPQLPLTITETNGAFDMAGVDSADFDKQGGDDLIALGRGDQNGREAFIFMNSVETLTAEAGADETVAQGASSVLSGASCTASPDDPNDPARFAVLWTLSPTSGATLTGADTLTPTFTATVPGTYTLTLQCRSRCTSVVTDTKQITVPGVPPPPPAVFTQGGCLANLTPGGNGTSWTYALLLSIFPLAWFGKRRGNL